MSPIADARTDQEVYADSHRDYQITGVIYINGRAISRGAMSYEMYSGHQFMYCNIFQNIYIVISGALMKPHRSEGFGIDVVLKR